jgi:hypothetical protein
VSSDLGKVIQRTALVLGAELPIKQVLLHCSVERVQGAGC